ncbi:MAG: Lrp/AsnC ligand binding domain-containing protein [Candidatus Thorarchaeota archaeon]
MAQAFILVSTELGAEDQVLAEAKEFDVVKEAYVAYGVYDVILKIQAPSLDVLKATIIDQVRNLPNVRSTLSMIVVETS